LRSQRAVFHREPSHHRGAQRAARRDLQDGPDPVRGLLRVRVQGQGA
jgi:hypothetical protein